MREQFFNLVSNSPLRVDNEVDGNVVFAEKSVVVSVGGRS